MRYIATDIDGVLTDGKIYIDETGAESKQICYRDLDAIGKGRENGYDFIFVTGESGKMVRTIAERFHVTIVYEGAKDKFKVINDICEKFQLSSDELIYIGDSDRDTSALTFVSHSYAPADATKAAKAAATHIVDIKGGCGVLLEVVQSLLVGGSEK